MISSYSRFLILAGMIVVLFTCKAQPGDEKIVAMKPTNMPDRNPAVAGSFYPVDKSALTRMLEGYFNNEPSLTITQPLAVIVPHAGYVFSGGVAAAAFKQIDRERKFQHIFLLASSHTMYFNGASIYPGGNFITPLGKVPVDPLAAELVKDNQVFSDNIQPHEKEHSIEVQLPFLQYWLKNEFSIIPIIMGGESEKTCREVAQALEPYFNENNLFVISTDFSHYPSYEDAEKSDRSMADAIISNSSKKLLQAKQENEHKSTPNLVTAMCGWTSVLSLLNITEKRNDIQYKEITHKNSGDSDYGEKDRVVGYFSICAIKTEQAENKGTFDLSKEEKKKLLEIARGTIVSYIIRKSSFTIDESTLTPNLKVPSGAFVTLKENDQLRGCIGSFQAEKPLYKTIQSMAIASSTEDYRFSQVTAEEIPKLEIEISVLTPMKKISSIDEIILGKHGVYIKKGMSSGTFLPQVATETGWSKDEFLGHCAQDKAHIGWNGWKDADIYIYEALIFEENEFKELKK
jgi:MEMO1 family protein